MIEYRGQVVTVEFRKERRVSGREDEDSAADARGAKRGPLLHRGDGVSPGVERLERLRGGDRAQSVGIGLDHRNQWRPRDLGYRTGILHQRTEVHLDPRTVLKVSIAGGELALGAHGRANDMNRVTRRQD